MPDTSFPEPPSNEPDPFDALLSAEWISAAAIREPTAAEREREAQQLHKKFQREGRRTRRRNRIRNAKKTLKPYTIPFIFLIVVAVFLVAQYSGNDSSPAPEIADVKTIRVIEVVTSDRKDEAPYTKEIEQHVAAMQSWLRDETGGRTFRLAGRSKSETKVERVVIDATASSMLNQPDIALILTEELLVAGVDIEKDEGLLVFTRLQPTARLCGQASGRTAVVFPFACSVDANEYSPRTELVAAHEIMHILGAVERCAPHATGSHHVSDDASDLMFEPSPNRRRAKVQHLDPGNDDYYGHGRRNCVDIKTLPVWVDG